MLDGHDVVVVACPTAELHPQPAKQRRFTRLRLAKTFHAMRPSYGLPNPSLLKFWMVVIGESEPRRRILMVD